MRKLLMLLLLLLSSQMYSQEYLPMLTEGRVWNCVLRSVWTPYGGGEDVPYTITVGGDSICDNRVWHKLHFKSSKNDFYNIAYEENGRLYYQPEGDERKPILLIDLNLSKGDEIEITGLKVEDVDTIRVNGISRKRITLKTDDYGQRQCWVEGIGSNCGLWADVIGKTPCEYWTFESCYDNGSEVFALSDFQSSPLSGINNVKVHGQTAKVMYDLSGRRIESPQNGQVYILNGRKAVGRGK